ncbi:molybdenum cofactor guanylyltransferase [Brevibacillus daliensis]|uniref:molybdenum cofactor guanylyltransferase n=1 Tax=Brevibacillus daliensis TaxID=2892995 RepID=UPI001E4E1ED8|nr:molybdenum cofactor guanylyltransferase [Brevibacillus daliensis]
MKKTVCAVVLAGGKSSRMGSPKELLPWRGTTLIENLINQIMKVKLPCVLVSNTPEELPPALQHHDKIQIIRDQGESCGPISGIFSAMRKRHEEWYLVLSCDLPFVEANDLLHLLTLIEQVDDHIQAIIPSVGGRVQPLFALYHKGSENIWRASLDHGDYRVIKAVESMPYRIVELPESVLSATTLFNMNSPVDYQTALLAEEKVDEETMKRRKKNE